MRQNMIRKLSFLSQLEMCFKKLIRFRYRGGFRRRVSSCFLFSAFCLLPSVLSSQEIIDRIMAVVNDKIITLTDVKIAEAFGLYEDEIKGDTENLHSLILEKLIDQKLVIQLTRGDISVEEEEVEAYLEKLTEKAGRDEFEKRLAQFDMDLEELSEYLREKILFQEIISRRFSQTVIVSLKEIEAYYNQNYVPSQKARGIEPKPMLELLDEMESAIKQEKIKNQVVDWIKNLKRQADIQIKKEKKGTAVPFFSLLRLSVFP